MQGLPALRVAPDRAARIGAGDLAAGALAVLVLVPAAAFALARLAGPAALAFPDGALRGWPAVFLLALALSPILSAPGLLLALPFALLAQRRGWTGWVPATLAGLLLGLAALPAALALGGGPGTGPGEGAAVMLPGGALLGLAFWTGVRLRRPAAFRADLT